MALLATLAFDARPTVFGNKAVVTGTLTNSGATSGHIDFADLLASVDTFLINGVGATAGNVWIFVTTTYGTGSA
jgi:hypothetical protein